MDNEAFRLKRLFSIPVSHLGIPNFAISFRLINYDHQPASFIFILALLLTYILLAR